MGLQVSGEKAPFANLPAAPFAHIYLLPGKRGVCAGHLAVVGIDAALGVDTVGNKGGRSDTAGAAVVGIMAQGEVAKAPSEEGGEQNADDGQDDECCLVHVSLLVLWEKPPGVDAIRACAADLMKNPGLFYLPRIGLVEQLQLGDAILEVQLPTAKVYKTGRKEHNNHGDGGDQDDARRFSHNFVLLLALNEHQYALYGLLAV
jgi:hypothetical protein